MTFAELCGLRIFFKGKPIYHSYTKGIVFKARNLVLELTVASPLSFPIANVSCNMSTPQKLIYSECGKTPHHSFSNDLI